MQTALVSHLKKVPIDFGQGTLRTTTKGKLIALDLVPAGRGGEALDVGCREGHQSRWLRDRGYSVTSIDVERAWDECQIVDVNEGLPFPDGSFDLVWCSEVIEHLADPEYFAREAGRVLRPGGKLILTTPNSGFWFYPLMRVFGFEPNDLQNPTHLHFFRWRDIQTLFPSARHYGFFPYWLIKLRIQRCIGLLSPTFVVEWSKP